MTPFALGFMLISMVSVTALTGYCLRRILSSPPPVAEDE